MMLQKLARIFLASALLFMSAQASFAQDQAQWKVGDKVETRNLSKEWVPGTIIGTVDWDGKLLYRVQLDDPNAPNVYFNHTYPVDIRARGGQQAAANEPIRNQRVADNPTLLNAGGVFKIGDRVDTLYDENRGHNRGTVIEVGDRKYKVHYVGCEKIFDEWVDASLTRTAATISADAPAITFLFGRWRTTAVAVGGNFVAWGKTPGIQINADGTYIWYQPSDKPPIKGKWTTDAKVPKLDQGTPKFDGVVVKDAEGNYWKAFKWTVKGYTKDGIEIDRMCSGLSEVGSRVR
jgi:hypothetical protein